MSPSSVPLSDAGWSTLEDRPGAITQHVPFYPYLHIPPKSQITPTLIKKWFILPFLVKKIEDWSSSERFVVGSCHRGRRRITSRWSIYFMVGSVMDLWVVGFSYCVFKLLTQCFWIVGCSISRTSSTRATSSTWAVRGWSGWIHNSSWYDITKKGVWCS